MKNEKKKLGRNVIVLSWVSFFQDAASELLYPVMPLFITGVLHAPPAVLGLIEGVAEGTASIMKAISGRLSDVRARKPMVGLGYGISSVSKLLIGFATGWPFVLFARFVDRTGKGIRTSPRDVLIVADTDPSMRGRAFGFHRAADTAGAVLGPLLALALYEAVTHDLRKMFYFAFIPAAISTALIIFVRESNAPAAAAKGRGRDLPGHYRRVVAFLTLFALINFSDALLILRAKELGFGFVSIVVVYALYNLSYAALSYPAGIVSDRMPRRFVFATGLVFFAVAYVGLGLVHDRVWVWVLLPLYGAYTALTDGVSKAWVSDLVPESSVGTGLGLYHALWGGGVLVAGIWAGAAWGDGGRFPLVLSGCIAAVLAVALLVGGRAIEGGPRTAA